MATINRKEIETRIVHLNQTIDKDKRNIADCKAKVRCLTKLLKVGDVSVSDHAILVYLLHKYNGVDMSKEVTDFNELVKDIRFDIIRKSRDEIIKYDGTCTINYDNIDFKVREYVIVTIINK